jgi:hypothetical protein
MTDRIIRQALADLRATLARLEAALEAATSIALPAPTTPHSDQEQAVLAFAALQDRLAAIQHWPEVQYQPWLNEDELSHVPLGQPIGDDFSAGWASLSLELERDAAPWLLSVALPGVSVPLAVLLESLPGVLALLADEALGARLARDGWVMPPVLLPLLVQIAPPGNQA